ARDVRRLGVGVADHERGGRQDEQLVAPTPIARETALHTRVKRLPYPQGAVSGEDRVGIGGGKVTTLVGIAGLEDDRTALGASRHVEPSVDIEMRILMR